MTADANTWRPPASTIPVRATGRGAAAVVSHAPDGRGEAGHDDRPAQYRRRQNGLAQQVDPSLKWHQRLLRNPYTWIVLAMTLVYAGLLFTVYRTVGDGLIEEVGAVTKEATGNPTVLVWGQINEAYLKVIPFAAATLGCYVLLLVFLDRLRPTTWSMKWLALGWGACAAVFISLHVNTWAGELMRAEGPVDPSQGARAAIFSAPFVEEAAKATILFFIAIAMRRRIVGVHQALTLAALSAAGFAFSENVVYYIRTYLYAVTIYGTDAEAELHQLFVLRGVVLSFGHLLFTSLTALGMIAALTNRSKIVRVLAPVAGYLAAAFGHMLFNGFASLSSSTLVLIIGGWIGVPVTAGRDGPRLEPAPVVAVPPVEQGVPVSQAGFGVQHVAGVSEEADHVVRVERRANHVVDALPGHAPLLAAFSRGLLPQSQWFDESVGDAAGHEGGAVVVQ